MSAFLVPAMVVIVSVSIVWLSAKAAQQETEVLSQIASGLNATFIRPSFGTHPRVYGDLDGLPFVIEGFAKSNGENSARWTRLTIAGISSSYSMVAQNFVHDLMQAAMGTDVLVGDAAFDRQVKLEGPRGDILASLPRRIRTNVADQIGEGVRISGGQLVFEFSGRVKDGEPIRRLRAMAQLARQMRWHPSELQNRLKEGLKDEVPGFQIACLEELTNHWPHHLTTEDWHTLLYKSSVTMGLAAVRLGGPEILPILESRLETERKRTVLLLCGIAAGVPGNRRARAVNLLKSLPDVLSVARMILDEQGDEATLLVVQALGWAGTPGVRLDALLVRRLQSPKEEVKRAAIEALTRQGTVAAVEALLPLSRGRLRGELGDAAEQAILAIQSRAGAATAGQLAVVETEGGLSMTPDAGGVVVSEDALGMGSQSEEKAGGR